MSNPKMTRRRTPSQERGERRLKELLAAAEAIFAEAGCDAATMTKIAERAEASIGALYQYFPDKEAMVLALRRKYADEIEVRWGPLLLQAGKLSIKQLINLICDEVTDYIERRPAYVAVLAAAPNYRREPAVRNRLREQFAAIFRERRPEMSAESAFRVANVTMQLLKGMNALYAEARNAAERQEVVREFKLVLTQYLNSRLKAE